MSIDEIAHILLLQLGRRVANLGGDHLDLVITLVKGHLAPLGMEPDADLVVQLLAFQPQRG